MARVWIAQCLCPRRHCILAAAAEEGEADSQQAIVNLLRQTVVGAIEHRVLNPWCGLCHASSDTWQYELRPTVFSSMEDATPELKRMEAEQALVIAAFSSKPSIH